MASLPKLTNIKTDDNNLMIERLQQWSSINTFSSNIEGLEKMVLVLEEAIRPLEGTAHRIQLPNRSTIDFEGRPKEMAVGQALKVTKRPEAPLQILLAGHYDTVFEPDCPFQKSSFVEANRLCGPGVADMKGGILILINSLRILENSEISQKVGWTILLTPDEEIGSPSSQTLYTQAAKEADVGLIFEPSFPDGKLVSARKGSASYAVVAKGRAAHAGRDFFLGRSAIAALAHFAVAVHELNDKFPGVTVNIGHITGGEAINIVPKLASCHVNVRANNLEDLKRIEDLIYNYAIEAAKNIARDREGIELNVYPISKRGPKLFDNSTQNLFNTAKRCGRELGIDIDWKPSGGVSDGNILGEHGLPTIDTLGAVGGHLHTYEEYIEIDSLSKRTRLAGLILLTLASEGFKI